MIKEKATVCTHQQQKKNHQIQNPKQMSGVCLSFKHVANSNHEISLIMAYHRILNPEQTANWVLNSFLTKISRNNKRKVHLF